MELRIIGEHVAITDALSNYIKQKFSHLPVPDKIHHVEFRLGVDNKAQQHVHFSAHCPNKDINITSNAENAYKAIDQLMGKIKRSFVKLKEQHKTHVIKQ